MTRRVTPPTQRVGKVVRYSRGMGETGEGGLQGGWSRQGLHRCEGLGGWAEGGLGDQGEGWRCWDTCS